MRKSSLNFHELLAFATLLVLEMRKKIIVLTGLCLLGFLGPLFPGSACGAERPAGDIGSVELAQIFDLVHLVDCRSRFEFDILHLKNAVHIPVANMVRDDLDRLLAKDPAKAIVFYGNGEGCSESRSAFLKAAKWGYKNIFVFWPGVLSWALERPDQVLFFGQVPDQDSQERLFGRKRHGRRLSPVEFVGASQQAGNMVVDIRDTFESDSFAVTLPNLKHFPVDRLVKLIKSGSRKVRGKKLFILDTCGGQAQWLDFVLEDSGIDYVFLAGGLIAWRQAGLDRFGNPSDGATP